MLSMIFHYDPADIDNGLVGEVPGIGGDHGGGISSLIRGEASGSGSHRLPYVPFLGLRLKRVTQFSYQNRHVGNVCEGNLTRYPAYHAVRLPE